MKKRKTLTKIISYIVTAMVLTILSGFTIELPLAFLEPAVCIQMVGTLCPPIVDIKKFFIDVLSWLTVVIVGWRLIRTIHKGMGHS